MNDFEVQRVAAATESRRESIALCAEANETCVPQAARK